MLTIELDTAFVERCRAANKAVDDETKAYSARNLDDRAALDAAEAKRDELARYIMARVGMGRTMAEHYGVE